MNSGARLGLAVTAGYLLGRFQTMKWALALAAFAGRGRLPGGSGGLLQQGAKLLTSSPELTKLTDEMRGRLVEAGKAAAVAAVSSKINSLSDDLRGRTEAMHAASAGASEGAGARDEENLDEERYRDEDERPRDKDRAADSGPRRHRDEDVDSRGEARHVPPPRGESDRPRTSRQSRSRGRAGGDRGSHPSRQDVEGNGARSGSPRRQPRNT
jgi:hypothetical protein